MKKVISLIVIAIEVVVISFPYYSTVYAQSPSPLFTKSNPFILSPSGCPENIDSSLDELSLEKKDTSIFASVPERNSIWLGGNAKEMIQWFDFKKDGAARKVQAALAKAKLDQRVWRRNTYNCVHFADDVNKVIEKAGVTSWFVFLICYYKPEDLAIERANKNVQSRVMNHAIIGLQRDENGYILSGNGKYGKGGFIFFDPQGSDRVHLFRNSNFIISRPMGVDITDSIKDPIVYKVILNDLRTNRMSDEFIQDNTDKNGVPNYCLITISANRYTAMRGIPLIRD